MKLCKVDGCDRLARSTEGYCNKHDIQIRRHGKVTDSKLNHIVGEVWKDIKGYDGKYKVSNKGRVVSLHSGVKELKPQRCSRKKGLYVTLGSKDINKTCLALLVAKYFLHPTFPEDTLIYIDDNEDNCSASNLMWGSSYLLPKSIECLQREQAHGYEAAEHILSFIQGEVEAITPVVQQHRNKIINVVSSVLAIKGIPSGIVTPDDIAQETFMKAFNLIRRGKLESVANIGAWLIRIAKNIIRANQLNYYRLLAEIASPIENYRFI